MGLFSFSRRKKEYLESQFNALHRHIDFLHDDLFVLLKSYLNANDDKSVVLETEFPVAFTSNDHLNPKGTIEDNTRCPKYFHKCEEMFPDKAKLRFLDMGCSSGGLVLDALLRGHFAIGLEGSDISLKEQRAQWRIIPDNLFTCDISKEFFLKNRHTGETQEFDVVSMWDVVEHIAESDLPQLLKNIRTHLSVGGCFFASVSMSESIVNGVELHVTRKPRDWWEKTLSDNGFEVIAPLEPQYMPRGGYNPAHCYLPPKRLSKYRFGIAARRISR